MGGISIKGYRGFRPPEDLIYSDLFVLKPWILYVSSPCAMGIISKSVAHACSGGARGLLRPNDQEYGKAPGVVKFYRDQEELGMYISEFKGPCSDFVRTGQRLMVATSTLSAPPGFDPRRSRLSIRLKAHALTFQLRKSIFEYFQLFSSVAKAVRTMFPWLPSIPRRNPM